jgi:hypothetical protein
MTDLAELLWLAEKATPGPWTVQTDKHPHWNGGEHTEHRIATQWHHPQLKGPLGVVNISWGIPETKGDSARFMVSISDGDAAYIAALSPDTAKKLIAVAMAAQALLPILDQHLFERGPEEEALRAALEELKGKTE